MALEETLLNPEVQASWAKLAKALASVRAQGAPRRPTRGVSKLRRPGQMRGLIADVLRTAAEPMCPAEIVYTLERQTGTGMVSYSTVKNCLRDNSSGPDALFERVGHGTYRLAAAR